jgi:ribosomal protein S18 acetylase RimI-like enzyme
MPVIYKDSVIPSSSHIINLYNSAGLPRPTADANRIQKMYDNSNLIITAWDDATLVGVSRCITDWCWSCYLADLAVRPGYQKEGIGKKLVQLAQEKVGEQVMILLLSVPTAMTYYPKIGFTKEDRAFAIFRSE